jgi:hypothetical protein
MEFAEKGGSVDSIGYEGLIIWSRHLEQAFEHP